MKKFCKICKKPFKVYKVDSTDNYCRCPYTIQISPEIPAYTWECDAGTTGMVKIHVSDGFDHENPIFGHNEEFTVSEKVATHFLLCLLADRGWKIQRMYRDNVDILTTVLVVSTQ